MAGISNTSSRTSTFLSGQQTLARLQTTQAKLAEMQKQIATGQAINRVSDDPAQVASVLLIKRRLQEREQEARNLDLSKQTLTTADSALGEATNTLIEAKTIASSQIGVGSDEGTRKAEALVIDAQLEGLVDLANTQFNGVSVFGGNNGAAFNGLVFERFAGGVRYVGSDQNLQTDVGTFAPQDFTSLGLTAFGRFDAQVSTGRDLLPQVTIDTKLVDVAGNTNNGFVPGALSVTVNGTSITVDLAAADSLDDVATVLTDAINTAAPGAGSVTLSPTGLAVTGNGGNTVSITDLPGSRVAASLGLAGVSSTGGAATAGADLGVRITPRTALADLGAGLDLASGLTITMGQQTVTVDLSSAATVQDAQNIVDELKMGVRLDIAEGGRSLAMVSTVAGLDLSVGENGGTTAADLGVRSFDPSTLLTDFRFGLGVVTQDGADDVFVELHDGRRFTANLDGIATVGDVLTAVNSAAAAAGITPGEFTLGLAAVGNGFAATDNTVGAGNFTIGEVGESRAATHLGLSGTAGAGNALAGADNAQRRIDNAFTNLINLRDALKNNNESGITVAAENLETDVDSVVSARAIVGVQSKRLEETSLRSEDQQLQEKTVLSNLQDADLTEVITKFQQLQLQLQASLQTSAATQQLSLLDYLR